MQTVRRGSKGQAVAMLQGMLNELGFNCGRVDGSFGPATDKAVRQFQAAHGIVADGVAGPQTWGVLTSEKAKQNEAGEPVYYSQVDPRWRGVPFTSVGNKQQTIGSSGCGPTCMAMVLATWRNRGITPVQTCQLAVDGGFRTANSGTAWAYFGWIASKFGLKFKQTSLVADAVEALKSGALVVASMGPGYFTRGGHYILPWKVDGNLILCHDPALKQRSKAAIDLFKREALQYFCFWR
ncbi:MAG: hypothetical protein JL50_02890 [Peptococcaceae bacterium BICA1-7]|nr:MAG: hypothetical protein JL50_02890 [Peptococcaceae bacterium BICA1-7]